MILFIKKRKKIFFDMQNSRMMHSWTTLEKNPIIEYSADCSDYSIFFSINKKTGDYSDYSEYPFFKNEYSADYSDYSKFYFYQEMKLIIPNIRHRYLINRTSFHSIPTHSFIDYLLPFLN